MSVQVFIQKLSEDVQIPQYAKQGDSGMDVRSIVTVELLPNQTKIIPTGLKVAIPEGYEIQVRPRSGLSYKTPLRVANSPGTIDSGYRDQIGVIITNTSNKEAVTINKDDRIAQLVLQQVPTVRWVVVDDVSEIGVNRNGGFGSTGIK
jgi:dUTP pyrophosphatase